jgi:hypothetical protein
VGLMQWKRYWLEVNRCASSAGADFKTWGKFLTHLQN